MFVNFPSPDELIAWRKKQGKEPVPEVNAHIHTPYSFSSFASIEKALAKADEAEIGVLGINDFFVTQGYAEFAEKCKSRNIFPLFNIEFIGVLRNGQNLRINDPNNPGRIYISGKGLRHTPKLSRELDQKLQRVIEASQQQMQAMIEKINPMLYMVNHRMLLSLADVRTRFAMQLVRERHIAKAIRVKAEDYYRDLTDRAVFYQKLFGKPAKSSLHDFAALENEIRSMMLKSGGRAFVPEDEKAFMSLDEIKEIIVTSGGIPTYPLLLDDAAGKYTEFEAEKEKLAAFLQKNEIGSIEFIPSRNSIGALSKYTKFFYEQGFVISFGTEHNTPDCPHMRVSCRSNTELDKYLKNINYKGACVIAAHQYFISKGLEGFNGKNRELMEDTGDAVIRYYRHHNKR